MKTIVLDLDGVVFDLATPWCEAYNKMYDDNISVDDFISEWNVENRAKCGTAVYEIFKQPGFFEDLPLIDGASDGIKELMKLGHVIIASAISCDENIAFGKIRAVKKHLPFFDIKDLILFGGGKRKRYIQGDVMIDDSLENLYAWHKENLEFGRFSFYTILVDSPTKFDCNYMPDYKALNWKDIVEHVKECI